ncbi:conserved membrane hypothetical protein [uncultured Defluviicoccus sp.]|uniref:Polysaccharide biosynthesis protein n=1 Tax=metagenome TaxID=256318 RepID=A0A380TLB1_9ZZZZ|nr:conserved membrane hypothetical protein [uncultured Defluviicoccus sp.]
MSEIRHSQGAKVAFTARMSPLDFDRLRRLAKEGGWIVAGQVAAVAGSLAAVRVLTEFLTPAQYGELALGLTIAGLVNQVVMGGVGNGIGRFYAIAAEKCDVGGYLNASRRLVGYATLVVLAMAGMLLLGLAWTDRTQWLGLAAAALIFALLAGYNSCLSSVQNAARQRQIVALHSALDSWLKIALAVGVMLWLGTSSTAVVIGYALSAFIVTASQLVFLRRLASRHLHRAPGATPPAQWAGEMWRYGWPFSTFGVFTWAQQASDRWALQAFSSTADVGAYAALFQLGYTPISIATGLMVTFLGPVLFQRAGDASDPVRNRRVHRLTWRLTWTGIASTGLAFAIALAVHKWLFALLVAAPYRFTSLWLPWMILAGGLFAAGQVLALKLMADMRPAATVPVKIATAVLGIGLNAWGAAYYGLPGVVAAAVVFSAIYLGWMMWLCRDVRGSAAT